MSKLQQQLAKLQQNQGISTFSVKDKKSLIFEKREANDLGNDVIYQMSLNSLNELIQKNQNLSSFLNDIFAPSSKSVDRLLLTEKENQEWDLKIRNFLILISPLFLSSNALKAIEWLVRRFNICEMNVNDVIESILPFHETPQFVKFISLLDIQNGSRWSFLKSVQKSSTPLTRSLLIDLAFKEPFLLEFIVKMFQNSRAKGIKNSTLISFFTYFLVEYFVKVPKVDENGLRKILPIVIDGLKCDEADFRAGAQIIVSIISKKIVFESEFVGELISCICKGSKDSTFQSMLCLSQIVESQNVQEISSSCVADLLVQESLLVPELLQMINEFECDYFISVLCKAMAYLAFNEANNDAKDVVVELLVAEKLDTQTVKSIIGYILNLLLSQEASGTVNELIVSILNQIHVQRFSEIDECVNHLFAETNGDKQKKYYSIISQVFSGSVNQALPDCNNTTLFLALQHPEEKFRQIALSKLRDILTTEKGESLKDVKSFIEPILLDRLRDTPAICSAVLGLPSLSDLIDNTLLGSALADILTEMKTSALYLKAIIVGLEVVDKNNDLIDLVQALIGSLLYTCNFVTEKKNYGYISRILKLAGIENDKDVIKILNNDTQPKAQNGQVIKKIMELVSIGIRNNGSRSLPFYISGLASKNIQMRIFSSLVIDCCINDGSIKNLEDFEFVVSHITKCFGVQGFKSFEVDMSALKKAHSSTRDAFYQQITPHNAVKFEGSTYIYILYNLIAHLPKANEPLWLIEYQPHSYETLVRSVFKTILFLGQYQQNLISDLISTHIQQKLIEFLFSLMDHSASNSLKLCALNMIDLFMQDSPKDFQILIPTLLLSLTDAEQKIRKQAIQLLTTIKSCCGPLISKKTSVSVIYGCKSFYGPTTSEVQFLETATVSAFLDTLLQRNQEILTDSEYLKVNLRHVLKPLSASKDKKFNEVLSFLISNVAALKNKKDQSLLISMLKDFDTVLKLKILRKTLEKEVGLKSPDQELLKNLLECYSVSGINSLFSKKGEGYFQLFSSILSQYETNGQITACCLAIDQIRPSWFALLDISKQKAIFSLLINGLAFGPITVKNAIKPCLQSNLFSAEYISPKLAEISLSLQDESSTGKRSKSDSVSDQSNLSVLIAFLEFLHFSSKIENVLDLVPKVVLLLNGLLNFTVTNVEYPKQLILTILDTLLQNHQNAADQLSEEMLRADLIVQCIRVTENPQTHNSALSLLSTLGKTHPQVVLMNIMPVFTFMGATVLRHDDNYSFNVVQRTLETIIPSLLQYKKENTLIHIKNIMEVFVNALSHIPSHRRLKLFVILANTVGETEYLGSLIALIIASPLITSEKPIPTNDELFNHKKFALQLFNQYDANANLCALDGIMKLVSSTPDEQSISETITIIDPSVLKTKTLRKIKLRWLEFINIALNSSIEKSGLGHEEDSSRSELHQNLIKSTLSEISMVHAKANTSDSSIFAKYINLTINALHDNLDTINTILSFPVFLDTVSGLLKDGDSAIKRRTLLILQDRIHTLSKSELDYSKLEETADIVSDVLVKSSDDGSSLENKQHALLCLASMAELFASHSLDKYSDLFSQVIGDHGLMNSNIAVMTTSLLAIGPFVKALGPRTITLLSVFVPKILDILDAHVSNDEQDSVIIIKSGLVALEAVFETIPQFSTLYIPRIVKFSSSKNIMMESEIISKEVKSVLSKMAQTVELRAVLPIIIKQSKTLIDDGYFATSQLVYIIGEIISFASQSALFEFTNDWSKMFIALFSGVFKMTLNGEESNDIQKQIRALFIRYTLKMNEQTFKPLYMKALDWGLSSTLDESKKQFFFQLTNSLLDTLKSIFIPYYVFILDSVVGLLEKTNASNTVGLLWPEATKSLLLCFTYDNGDFITVDRFTKLLNPLVDQLDLRKALGQEYKDQMNSLIIPALGHLATIRTSDECLKPLNKAVLMKTRSDDPSVRWAALKVILEFYTRLGDEMLVHFPETIPFLAELLEDRDPEVEQLSKQVCLVIQNLLGEPIAPYFES